MLAKPSLPQVNTLKSALEDMEKERDYYFGKLREVELLCQEEVKPEASLVEQLMMILYAADEQVGPPVQLDWFSSLGGWRWEGLGGRPSLRLRHVWSDQRKTSVFMLSHVTLLRLAEAFMAQFSHLRCSGRSRAGGGQRGGGGAAAPGRGRRRPAGGAG